MSTVLSIQSSVAYGHVGNSAVSFTLMRMGVETYPVFTVHYSNSTRYGEVAGPNLTAADVADVIAGVDRRGALGGVDAVLSGFLGTPDMANTVIEAAQLVKQRNPKAVYCCDPVMGDVGRGMYVGAGIPEHFRDVVVPHADIVTPNQYELDFLVGRESKTTAEVLESADILMERGPKTVLVTSAIVDDAPANTVSMIAVTADEAWQVTTPLLDQAFTGSGDVTTAVFLAKLLETGQLDQALRTTAEVVYSLLEATKESGQLELVLVAAQDQLVAPKHHFAVQKLR
jgi:pyridoxine kinase